MDYARILEEFPELLESADPERRAALSLHTVPIASAGKGPWDPPPDARGGPVIAILIRAGFLLGEALVTGKRAAVLAGPGDVIFPRTHPEAFQGWRVLQPASFGLVDREFLRNMIPHPGVAADIMGRGARFALMATVQVALGQLRSAQASVLTMLTLLARHWGEDGDTVPLKLRHADLANMVGLNRQTTTTALNELERGGWIEEVSGGRWLIKRPNLAEETVLR